MKKDTGTKRIYMDNAAMTPVDKEVLKTMSVFSDSSYANPSAIHKEGVKAQEVVLAARKKIADVLRGHADEIVFTASGTEANNLAIFGLVEAEIAAGKKYSDLHIITSVIEHASILECVAALETKGVKVSRVGVNEQGIIDVSEIKKALTKKTILVSIQYVNNEIGTIQPIHEIAKLVRHARKDSKNSAASPIAPNTLAYPYLHVDACQTQLYLSIDTRSFGADLITFDGQKIRGPRGIGALWMRRGVTLAPLVYGGGQERGLRSGTENVASIAGLARAFELAETRREKEAKQVAGLRDHFIEKLKAVVLEATLNGGWVKGDFTKTRIANNINFSLPDRDTEFILIQLDEKGIACSTKSSCLRDEDESYVVAALGGDTKNAAHSLRFSLGRETTKADVDYALACLHSVL